MSKSFEICGAKVYGITSTEVTIGTHELLQIITPYSDNGKYIEIVNINNDNSWDLHKTYRYLTMAINDDALLSMKDLEDMLNEKCLSDFSKIVKRIENKLDEVFYCKEQTVYFYTLPQYTASYSIDKYYTTYEAKYSFAFYKPLTFDTYNLKDKYMTDVDLKPSWTYAQKGH